MSENKHLCQKVANCLAECGFIDDFFSFFEKYGDKISYTSVLKNVFDSSESRTIDKDYVIRLVDYYYQNFDYNEKKRRKLLETSIRYGVERATTHMIKLGTLPTYDHLIMYLTRPRNEQYCNYEYFSMLVTNLDKTCTTIDDEYTNAILTYQDKGKETTTLRLFKESGYDFRTISPNPTVGCWRIRRCVIKALVEFETDFTSEGWQNYLVDRVYNFYGSHIKKCIGDVELLLDVGVLMNHKKIVEALKFATLPVIKHPTYVMTYTEFPSRLILHPEDNPCMYVSDSYLVPTELLNMFIGRGLDIGDTTILVFDGCTNKIKNGILESKSKNVIVTIDADFR